VQRLEGEGFEITVLPVDRHGRVEPEQVAAALRSDTVLVSVMLANNETGTLQPIAAIAAVCRAAGVLLHSDATQAVGKIAVDVGALGVDLLSLSGHKIYGPRGVGALIVRRRRPRLRLVPLLDGGGHEGGARSGTLNTPGVVGLARALEIAGAERVDEGERLTALRERLRDGIAANLDGVHENGHPTERLPNTLNLSFEGVDGNALLVGLSEVAVSSGSACTSAEPKPSHVLAALGVPPALAAASLRFSLGRANTERDVDTVAAAVCRVVAGLRDRSPLTRPPARPGI
jgi:cysteine desulfurase